MAFDLTSEVEVERDASNGVLQLRHTRRRYTCAEAGLGDAGVTELCDAYLRDVASAYRLPEEEIATASEAVTAEPLDEGVRLRREGTKEILDTTVVTYRQTCCGLPVWNSTFSVLACSDPPEVVSSSCLLLSEVDLGNLTAQDIRAQAGGAPASLAEVLGDIPERDEGADDTFSLNRDPRLLVYRYLSEERLEVEGDEVARDSDAAASGQEPGEPLHTFGPTLPLPPVPPEIVPGRDYVVREILFALTLPGGDPLNWRALVEIATGAVLYLRALTAASTGTCCVFESDPVSKTGVALTASSPTAILNAVRTCGLPLENLDPPESGVQSLRGKWAALEDSHLPNISPPTATDPYRFEFPADTPEFAAANAYYHTDWMYRLVEELGFDLPSYFDGTSFPVPVDHRGERGDVNAHADGNGIGEAVGRFRYGLVQSDQPVGMATTVRVCLHEFSHALLWDHVRSPNFGWAHSVGDALAAILNDPDSKVPPERRFETFPFVMGSNPGLQRRHDREVADGWAWGGAFDDRQYGSEQILATLMFRIYRVTGGDDEDVATRKFAARYLTYLIVRAIGSLTTPTTDPRVFVGALLDADDLTIDFEGHPGGAWHKIVRWSFEKQGLYQPPGALTPVTTPGAPPSVDVYIDDGRAGEYEPYLAAGALGASPAVWNRRTADEGGENEDPAGGVPNFLYVRVGNRGTDPAVNPTVSAYQGSLYLGDGPERWPDHWTPATTASLPVPTVAPGGIEVVGPFVWTPPREGTVSVLLSVSAPGDLSNAETVNGSIGNERLIRHDNNVARRDFEAVVVTDPGPGLKMASGTTGAGETKWIAYAKKGVYVDIDTSAHNFQTVPRYFTSIGGRTGHWATTGATSIYNASATGFRVYVRWINGAELTPEQARRGQWHINWFAIEG